MSIANVLTYARARCTALGYVEHKDALNFENVPAQVFGRTFHVLFGEPTGISDSQDAQALDVPFAIRIFLKGKVDTIAAMTDATERFDALLTEVLKAINRAKATGLVNITYRTGGIGPVAGSNDNAMVVRAEFTARTYISTR